MKKTRLIEMKPVDAIKQTLVKQGFFQPVTDYEKTNRHWYEGDVYIEKYQPTLYHLHGRPKRFFLFEELQPIQDI